DEGERHVETTRLLEDLGVRCNPHDGRQHGVGQPERRVSFHRREQPAMTRRMVRGVAAMRVQKNVDVRERYSIPPMRSRSADVSSRSTPGWRPSTVAVTIVTVRRLDAGPRATAARNASSITWVIVRPVSRASFFTWAMSPGGNRTVVRICQDILLYM